MPLFRLTKCGLFDSNIKRQNAKMTPERVLTEYELEFFVDNTNGALYVDDDCIPAEKGRVIISKPGQKKHILFPIKCLYLHLNALNTSAVKLLSNLPDTILLYDLSEYIKKFDNIIKSNCSSDIVSALFTEQNVLEILFNLQTNEIAYSSSINTTKNKDSLVKAKNYMKNNYNRPISLESLAKIAHMNPTYFHKQFKAYYGKTPNKYLLNIRIAKAKLLLIENRYSLTHIASMCGFSSPSYFSQIFKKETGTTPLVFKNEELSKLKF